MFLREIHIQHFRNYEDERLSLTEGLNVLIGENAQGKTNALEAIYLLAMGKSHRTSKDTDLLMWGQERTTIEAVVSAQQRDRVLALEIGPSGKKAQYNHMPMQKMSDFIGHFQAVLFAPEDLALVKGGPSVRRRFIDMELGQTHPKYVYHLAQFARTMQQRNALLKSDSVNWDYVSVFDEQLVEHGVQILLHRFKFLQKMEHFSNQVYATISGRRENFGMKYRCSIPGLTKAEEQTAEVIGDSFRRGLVAKRGADKQMGYTTIGPHRDDLQLFLNEQPVQAFASQGQQRTIALSLRLAEIDFIFQEIGEYPVLLLDDVLSELDDERQRNLVLSMSEKVQTVITTTSLFQLADRLHKAARLFHVRSGIIHKEG